MSEPQSIPELTAALAELTVRFGANLQPGQIMAICSEPGKEELTRAIADAAYAHGAKFVDLSRVRHPPQARAGAARRSRHARLRAAVVRRADARARRDALRAIVADRSGRARTLLDDVDPELLGADMLPRHPGVDRGRQRPHDQLDRRPVPDPRLGRARAPGARARRARSTGCGRRSPTSAGWTRPTRWRPGASAWTRSRRSPASSTGWASTRCASRARAPT